MSKKVFTKQELERLIKALDAAMDLDHDCVADTGYSWKEACSFLRQLRNDKGLHLKLSQLWEFTRKEIIITTDSEILLKNKN